MTCKVELSGQAPVWYGQPDQSGISYTLFRNKSFIESLFGLADRRRVAISTEANRTVVSYFDSCGSSAEGDYQALGTKAYVLSEVNQNTEISFGDKRIIVTHERAQR